MPMNQQFHVSSEVGEPWTLKNRFCGRKRLDVNERIYFLVKLIIQTKTGDHKTVDLNRRKAIRERCLNCSGWIPKEVSNCGFTNCPLYPFRSGKGKQNQKMRELSIRRYCLWCVNGHRSEIVKCVSRDCPLFAFRMNVIDRSAKIESLLKMVDIEAISKNKND